MSDSVLTAENVYKEFWTSNRERVAALQAVSIAVPDNAFVCIVGPSGCGKSTLLRLFSGLEKPTSGQVSYRQKPVNRPSAQIGMVFQEYSLLPWRTVADNVALGLEFAGMPKGERAGRAADYLGLVGLGDFAQAYPHELSGGMRQRAAIARALAVAPDVLLMDEPFGALDAHMRILLQKELLRIWENHRQTVIFVTHSVDEALYLADIILVMSRRPGRIKATIQVDMPRPRDRAIPRYGQLYADILAMMDEVT
ncbi:Bicarbonate transport ATP-binding protein CmpD [Sporomusa ovata DSM 2662]|uniref:ABC-type nitrate/sulfonate/bicarbonate transport system, ATPase component n=1 Tax=Sporomusa ovata TaxID=2378 RepID=A0A0U1KUT1_9FIRM|nr:ABC transporter ATP-binding protein [Sporomusa ovata]EQB27078.1 ABC-type nitrate/sulfonate/bicarbonate transport system, ATPase component [Sporomusa ovata DSM 2662]CQR71182.1 ABC-type nitrate/sulfonate/bicarbonate transport system, ATPase component [Sporomusa ovata]